jgi:riboflavin biosynthesis pyrimidine reductase
MKPHVVCHMMVSLDGRIHPSRWTERLLSSEVLAHGIVHLRYAVEAAV